MNRVWLGLLFVGAFAIAGYAVYAYGFRPLGSLVHPQMKATYEAQRAWILTHVFCSALAMAVGPWQFVPGLRGRWPAWHRWSGRAYLAMGVLPGGVAGLYMAFHAFGGLVSTLGFSALAVAWLVTGWLALTSARARDFKAHRAWMVRNFALTLAALTLRVHLGVAAGIGLSFESYYPWLAWTCWIPNLLLAQWLVGRRSSRDAGLAKQSLINPRPPA
jgi:hypothetical protein